MTGGKRGENRGVSEKVATRHERVRVFSLIFSSSHLSSPLSAFCFLLSHLALEAQHDLLGRLRLLVEDGLGLAAVAGLLPVVPALTCEE